MSDFRRELRRPRRGVAGAIAGAALAAALCAPSFMALAQDQSAATVEDVIMARKTMMDTLSDNMDQIEQMISTNKIDLADAHEHADTISVMLMAFPHLFPPASNQWKPGVEIDFEDSGPGIPAELREQIFNPFFTTKKDGVGLGLPIVSKIVDEHGGSIRLMSGPGEGARFRVFLPLE